MKAECPLSFWLWLSVCGILVIDFTEGGMAL